MDIQKDISSSTSHEVRTGVELRVPTPVRAPHLALAERLEDLPAAVALVPVDAPGTSTTSTSTATSSAGRVVVDLTDRPVTGWHPTYDGRSGDAALRASLARGRFPLVEVRDFSGAVVAAGRPGSEQPGSVATAYADVLAGVGTLLLSALAGRPPAAPVPDPVTDPPAGAAVAAAAGQPAPRPLPLTLARRAAGAVARRGYRALYRTPHWRVGWRLLAPGEPDVLDTLEHPEGGWHDLPDDGHHFYADPFPFVHGDETWLFVEDFDHRVGRGVISAVGFDGDGPVGTPSPVLRHDVHLSYPFVLEHGGETWMIPETSAAGRIELHRARSFPHRWERETVLVDGVEASDATVLTHAGRWWMLATVRHGGSCSDTLQAWSATALTGPWTPHPHGPLLVDIAGARPAGRVVVRDGRLLRPVQDNRTGYGAALLVTEVTRLDGDGFDQRVVGGLTASARWPGRRLHTLNRAGPLEVIDGSAMSPRVRLPHTRGRTR